MPNHFPISVLKISWTTSRARDTYGYNICRLDDRATGRRFKTTGGGYDMVGTVVGDWLEANYQPELQTLAVEFRPIPEGHTSTRMKIADFYGVFMRDDGTVYLDGGCGIDSMMRIAEAIGVSLTPDRNRKGQVEGYFYSKAAK